MSSAQPTILVVEDSEVIRALLRAVLEEREYEVVEAVDGLEGVELARERHPDVVLMDVEMPRMNGYQALANMKRDPGLSTIPVVFLTARSEPEEMVLALEAGGHDYLSKPFETPELLARIQAALRANQLQSKLRELNRILEVQASTDALTGLNNRRSLDTQLTRSVAAAHRRQLPIAVLMLDVDHFKQVNDSYGHHTGDRVLVEIANRLYARTRGEDMLGRWGGEEFMVITGETDAAGAELLAETFRAAIADREIRVGEDRVTVTTSVGWAVWDGDTAEELVRRADRALFAAKDAGRNTSVRG